MSAAFTPGPWRVVVEHGDKYLRAPGVGGKSNYKTLMCDMQYYPWIDCSDADWQLIAAAPDLLAALQGFVNHGTCFDERDMTAARAAIAKATGGAA